MSLQRKGGLLPWRGWWIYCNRLVANSKWHIQYVFRMFICSPILVVLSLIGNKVYVVRVAELWHAILYKEGPALAHPSLLMDCCVFGKFYNFSLKNKPINVRKNIFPPNGVFMPGWLGCPVCRWAGEKARGTERIFWNRFLVFRNIFLSKMSSGHPVSSWLRDNVIIIKHVLSDGSL